MANIPIYKLTPTEAVVDDTLIKATPFVTGYTYGGSITPSDTPLTEAVNAFYLASTNGTYTNFGGIVVSALGFIYYKVGDGYSFQAIVVGDGGGSTDEIDGDMLQISWTPTNYTPLSIPTEVDATNQLTAHLYGIDQVFNNSTNWNTAYTDRNKWDGGVTGLNAATGRASLGANTIGSNLFTSTNPSAVRFLRTNADNSISWLTAAEFLTAIGAGTSTGTVSSVAMTVPTGLTVSGSPITSSGTLAVALQSGYQIPTTTALTNAATAYSWGNHAIAGYLTDDSNYAKLNAANIFTANQNINKTTPIFNIKSTDATARKIEFLNSSNVGVGNITSNVDGSLHIQGSTDIELNAGSENNFRVTGTNHFIEGLSSGTQTKIIGYNTTTGEINYQDPPGDSGYAKLNIANTFTAKQTTSFSSANYVSEIYNTNALGNGLLVQTSALGPQPIFNAQTAAVNDLFRVNANGTIRMSNLPLSTKNYIIGYDPTTGYISYQYAVPEYTASAGVDLTSNNFTLDINSLPLMSGASIVDADYFPIYDSSTGADYKVLMSGLKSYIGGFADPMTTFGDIIFRGSSTPSRLPIGSVGQVLTVSNAGNFNIPSWQTPSGGSGTVTSVTAGNGMTQTGTATINPTLNIVSHEGSAGSIGTINVGADAIGVNLGTTSTTAYRGDLGNAAYTGRIASLTTTGTSGAATFTGNVLNIPNYSTTLGDAAYDNYYINTLQLFSAGVDGYIDIYTIPSNTASTIFAVIDMHIDHGLTTYKHISGHFSSDWAFNAINRQNWVEQYSDYRTSNISLTPELVDNGTTGTFRIKVNSPVTAEHHYVLTVKYLHK